jgi:hypothetical protein
MNLLFLIPDFPVLAPSGSGLYQIIYGMKLVICGAGLNLQSKLGLRLPLGPAVRFKRYIGTASQLVGQAAVGIVSFLGIQASLLRERTGREFSATPKPLTSVQAGSEAGPNGFASSAFRGGKTRSGTSHR